MTDRFNWEKDRFNVLPADLWSLIYKYSDDAGDVFDLTKKLFLDHWENEGYYVQRYMYHDTRAGVVFVDRSILVEHVVQEFHSYSNHKRRITFSTLSLLLTDLCKWLAIFFQENVHRFGRLPYKDYKHSECMFRILFARYS